MVHYKDSESNGFVRHEIKTYQRKGDQIRSEYERLNPDGTVTKTVAFGDVKDGLKYRTYHMGLDGAVREVIPEIPPQVIQAPPPPPPPPATQDKTPRKGFAFVVEPKENAEGNTVWKVRPLNLKTKESPEPAAPQPSPRPQPEKSCHKSLPWWYDTLKEAINDSLMEEKPKEKLEPPPPPPEPKKLTKRIFDWLDEDFFPMKPLKSVIPRPKVELPIDTVYEDYPFAKVVTSPLFSNFKFNLED